MTSRSLLTSDIRNNAWLAFVRLHLSTANYASHWSTGWRSAHATDRMQDGSDGGRPSNESISLVDHEWRDLLLVACSGRNINLQLASCSIKANGQVASGWAVDPHRNTYPMYELDNGSVHPRCIFPRISRYVSFDRSNYVDRIRDLSKQQDSSRPRHLCIPLPVHQTIMASRWARHDKVVMPKQ